MTIDEYILAHIEPQSLLLCELERRAHVELMRPRMIAGHYQGRLLKMLVRIARPLRILELGTYTGYATLCMAEALDDNAEIHSIESDDEIEAFTHRFVDRSPSRHKIRLYRGNALSLLPEMLARESYNLIYIDANKREYTEYYRLLIDRIPVGALIVADNTLWDGKVIELSPHDAQTRGIMSFNDLVAADKRVEQIILPVRDGLSLIYKKG